MSVASPTGRVEGSTAFPTPPQLGKFPQGPIRIANRSLKRVFVCKKPSRGQRRWNWLSPVPAPLTLHYTH
jgi:hypothetical protein